MIYASLESPEIIWLYKFAMKLRISAEREAISNLLKEVLFHSRGHGNLYDGAMPSFILVSKGSILELSNEVSFVSKSCMVSVYQLKAFYVRFVSVLVFLRLKQRFQSC